MKNDRKNKEHVSHKDEMKHTPEKGTALKDQSLNKPFKPGQTDKSKGKC